MGTDAGLDRLNALAPEAAAEAFAACCAAPAWVSAMLAGRPYDSRARLVGQASDALAALDWSGVRAALDAHPRIGERVAGAGREAEWSRREQAGTRDSSEAVRAALVEANQAYERRFGHIFLIFASGRTDTELLAAARERLANGDDDERSVVRGELDRIVALRVERLVAA